MVNVKSKYISIGGNTLANIGSEMPSTAYQNEVVNPVTTNTKDNAKECSAKKGLMYVSDNDSNENSIAEQNWLY